MTTTKAALVTEKNGKFSIVANHPVRNPGRGEVQLKVICTGVCHSDFLAVTGLMGNSFPRAPGHEVVGDIVQVGEDVSGFSVGQRVAIGWYGGACGTCTNCRRGDFIFCDKHLTCGITYDGGYSGMMVVPQSALARVPEGMDPVVAGPLACAGITVFNSLRNMNIPHGKVVAIQGCGGLGHLGIQFARAMGYETVCISTSNTKRELAMKLGAHHYFSTADVNVVAELQKLGGAACILSTALDPKAMGPLIEGLSARGKLVLLGAGHGSFDLAPLQLIPGSKVVMGWASGTSSDTEDTLHFF
jgi:D-arabinose 1-dehydrogenase-like Zn-dependent alcohol dehydrogenase